MRNDMLSCIAAVPGGVAALRTWCQLWADGLVAPKVAEIMTRQMLKPLKKPNGKPRPIALLEVLLKLASGVVQDVIREMPGGEGLDWNQYGSHPAGPELMLMVGQGLMNLAPHLAFISLDLTNAFGRAKRTAMLRGAARWCPAHCRFLHALWSVPNIAWVESAPGEWAPITVKDGAFQGDTSSTPSFSRGMRAMVEEVCAIAQAQGIWAHPASLVDDLLIVAAPENVDALVDIVDAQAQIVLGTQLNRDKCKVYIPERSVRGAPPHPAIKSIEQTVGGLPALGAAYNGEFEAVLGPFSLASEPARKRLEAAVFLANQCAEYAIEAHAPATRQSAWSILQKCAARALQYDIRTLEPSESKPLAEELDKALCVAARALLGPLDSGWSADQSAQLTWPASLSGMGLGSVMAAARIGRVACLAQCLPTAREHIRQILPDVDEERLLRAIPLQGALAELENLEQQGIVLAWDGSLATGAEPRLLSAQYAGSWV